MYFQARPTTGPDDGLLRVEANGICGSDVHEYLSGPETIPAVRGRSMGAP